MFKRVLSVSSIVVAVFALSSGHLFPSSIGAFLLAAVEPQQTPALMPPMPPMPGMPATPATPQMSDMMKMHEQMMAEMKTADAKLDQLVSDMNAATGDAKVAAMARVVTELANQQKTMHGRMGSMHEMMMGGGGMMMKR